MRRFPPVPRRALSARLFVGTAIAVGLALTTISAQIPSRNVNMVAGNTWPNGDPYLQRQNEPSIGASTRNPLHLLAGANDYRTVDLPGLAEDETGDAWLGLFKSFDGGQRWISTLLPGYPQDHSAAGLASPIHGYGAGADAVVRAGTNGLMYFAGLAFDRANPATPDIPGKSAIFVARFIDNNNKEAGDPFEYLNTRVLQKDPGGATGNFLDKPWLAVDVPRDASRCTIVTPGEKGPVTQNIPAGPVYVAYTLRSTDKKGDRYDIMFTRSADCGNTWAVPTRLNDEAERANQGAAMAIDPRNGNVFITWRQFDLSDNDSGTDALMVAKFNLPGKKLDAPKHARKFDKPKKKDKKKNAIDLKKFYRKGGVNQALEAAELSPLDQSTSAAQIRFRTNAYPSMVIDQTGRIYLAWAERGYDPLSPDPVLGSARVLIATSADGATWTAARPVNVNEPGQRGHQLMPSLTYGGGKLMLIYYDVRESRAQAFTQYIDDKTAFQPGVGTGLRHTIDLRASMAAPGANPSFAPSVAVSEYIEGPRVPGGPSTPWQVNPPNLPMFQKGTAPFIGDYVDLAAAPNFVLDGTGKWVYNSTAGSTPPIFHAAWTDNRDVRVPLHDMNGDGNPWNDYVPPGAPGGIASVFDPTKIVPQCIPGNAGSRNQNIYTARITGGLLVGSPGNNKRLGFRVDENGNQTSQLMQRSFVVFAQNTSDTLKRFRFTINNQPAGGRASFEQFSAAPLTSIDADIPYRSTASRTVYATSTDPHAIINVSVAELEFVNGQWVVKAGGLGSVIVLNPDIDNPDIDNPDIDNPDIDNPDIDNAEVYNPDIDNPDIDNPDIDNPDIDNPDIDNPDIDNVEVANPDIDNPDIDNPDIDNPDIDNPDIDNPDIDNPDIDNASLMTDVSWSITNTGNTTASYNVNLFFAQQTYDPSIKTQLILYRTYKTPVVVNCELKSETRNMLVANVPNPQLVRGSTGTVSNPNDSAATNATIYLAPGESAKITLRIFDPSPDEVVTVTNRDGSTALISAQFVPNEDVTPVVQQQSVNTEDVDAGVTEPPVVVQFPAPQTVPDTASTSENTPVTLNPLANDSSAFGSTKIISFHPEGMGAHSGGSPGDITYQPATGFLYTQRGAVDPATNALVGRFGLPAGGLIAYQQANPRTGINYQRTVPNPNAVLSALDARPDSLTFHQYLPMPALADSVMTFTIDSVRNRLIVLHGEANTTPTARSWFSVIDINPASPSFHTVLYTIALPDGLRGNAVAVNSRTQKAYVTTGFGQGQTTPAVYVVEDGVTATHSATRIPNTFGTSAIAVNEASNQVFVSSSVFGNNGQVYQLLVIDGATLAVAPINTNLPPRLGNADERLVVHEASGKVFVRLGSAVVVFDGRKGSPSRNTVLAVIPVGADANNADIAIDQELGRVITTGGFDFRADVIDVATLQSFMVPLANAGSDVAVDPLHHVGFVSTALTSVVKVDLTGAAGAGPIAVFVEAGGPIVNPVTNRAYVTGTVEDSGIGILTGAGFNGVEVPVANDHGRFNFSARQDATNRFFILNQGNQAGTSNGPGTVVVVDGANDSVIKYLNTLPNPFGVGIDQVTAKMYVASSIGDTANGGLRRFDLDDLNAPGVDATFTTGVGSTTGFAINNPNALIGFSRFVVPNPNDHRVYVAVNGGTSSSVAVYDPASNVISPLDGRAGTVLFDYQASHGQNWGRANIIRVDTTLNRIIIGFDNGTTNRIVALNGSTHQVITTFALGDHSDRHTASYIVIDEAMQRMFVTNYAAGTVTMLDSSSYAPVATAALPQGPSAQALNLTAHRLYVSSIDSKALSAIAYTPSAMTLVSSVRLPLAASFLAVDEVESRIYTGGGDSLDESGAMVVTDVLGRLGVDVNVTNVSSSGHGTVTLNPDFSVTYRPAYGFAGVDTFNYTLSAPTGTAVGTVTINVVPSAPALLSFGDAYTATLNQPLTVAAPGPLANDAAGTGLITMVVDSTTAHGQLTPQADGSFVYVPAAGFTGIDTFTYHAVSPAGTTNASTVTITVSSPLSLIVTNTNDSGAGSLRQAMAVSQVETAATITFNIPGEGPHVIQPQSPLPTLTQRVTIDGYTQPGSLLNTSAVGTNAVLKIQLAGASAGGGTHGLLITGGGATIRGLAIGGFSGAGIQLDAEGGNVIEGNFLGTNASGTSALPNGAGGIIVQSGGNMIGGNTFGARNLISGNGQAGVRVQARTQNGVVITDGSGSVVKGNLIGTTASGLSALPNGNNGVSVSVSNVIIGGTANAERNVISGNSGTGISTFAFTATPLTGGTPVAITRPEDLLVQGNYIGMSADGSARLPNTNGGMFLSGRTIVGGFAGTTPGGGCNGACNVISGNNNHGINLGNNANNAGLLLFTSAEGSIIEGNFIGVDPTGTSARANNGIGIIVGAPNIAIRNNVISGNLQSGIVASPNTFNGSTISTAGTGAMIAGNLIGVNTAGTAAIGNGGSGIDVGVSDVTIGGVTSASRNVIAGNAQWGINSYASTNGSTVLTAGSNLTIRGNYIGTRADGMAALPNKGGGLQINGQATIGGTENTTPGGACTGACNLISGNGNQGIGLNAHYDNATGAVFTNAAGSIVQGNYIGVNVNGTAALGNSNNGIGATVQVSIGGSTAAARNVIAGNGQNGISLGTQFFSGTNTLQTSAAGSTVRGNYIGIAANGDVALGNSQTGISLSVRNVRVGGAAASDMNVISGNGSLGISAFASRAANDAVLERPSGLLVENNRVGTNASGLAARPNQAGGLFITGADSIVRNNLISGNSFSGGFNPGLSIGVHFENQNAQTYGTIYSSPDNTIVVGNIVGLDANGQRLPNNNGIFIGGPNVTVGGPAPADRNIVSGNIQVGITLGSAWVNATGALVDSARGTKVIGNIIGLDAAGNALIINSQGAISSSADHVTIGGPTPAEGNLLGAANNTSAVGLFRHTTVINDVPVLVNAGGTTLVQNNSIGIGSNGAALHGAANGILIGTPNNSILGNTIAGLGGAGDSTNRNGIEIFDASARGNVLRGNFIGTTAGGSTTVGNSGFGISITYTSDTTIGGASLTDRNVIAGNSAGGIFVNAPTPGSFVDGTIIVGNFVGVLSDGATPLPNGGNGIMLNGFVSRTVIGGSAAGERNLIGGNTGNGIGLYGAGVRQTTIRGNFIGVGADGTTDLRNTAAGVWISGANDNTVGGPNAADGNIIAGNNQTGVGINAGGVRNTILSNRIFGNGLLGIDLRGDNAVQANDNGDADFGENELQNFPLLTSVDNSGAATKVNVDLSTFRVNPGNYVVQVFANSACGPAGYGQGARFVGTAVIVQPGGQITLTERVPNGEFLTATATDAAGNTSEFSACLSMAGTPTLVTNTNLTGPGSLANAMTYANNTPGTQTITFNIPGAGPGSPAVISLGGVPMPIITESVVIDATSQPGYDGRPVIQLSGNGNVANGFETAPDVSGVAIRGFSITRFSNAGIFFMQADGGQFAGNQAQLNFIGTDRNLENGLGNGVGIVVRTDYSTIGSNVISGNNGPGVRLETDADNVLITANKIGTTFDGQGALGNAGNGVTMYDSLNNNVFEGNIISGNSGWGVDIQDSLAGDVTGTRFHANIIGLGAGSEDLGNLSGGIRIDNAPGTQIGEPGFLRNHISGNGGLGIQIGPGIQVAGNAMPKIQNNNIGLDLSQQFKRGNNNKGITLDGPALVGGSGPSEGNLISGNGDIGGGAGIIVNPGAGGSSIVGNTIGLNINGQVAENGFAGITVRSSTPINIGDGSAGGANLLSGNGAWGIAIIKVAPSDAPANVVVERNIIGSDLVGNARPNVNGGILVADGTGHRIGGNSGRGNLIAFNGGQGGIRVTGAATQVRIQENDIRDNFGIGIDLNGDGPTANSGPFHSSGPNLMQSYAPMVLAANNGGQTRVKYDPNTLNPGVPHTIEFFSSPSCDASGFGEGSVFRGSVVINGGAGTQTFTLDSEVPLGHVVTSTTTDPSGNTSEFSNCTRVVQATTWTAGGSGTTNVANNGETLTPSMSYNHSGPNIFSGNWSFNTVAASAGSITLDYAWSGFHSFFMSTARLDVFVNRGGVDVFTATLRNEGPETCPPCTPPSNGFNYTGTTSVNVQPGDTYGFRMFGTHADGTFVLSGTLQVTVKP